MRCSLHVLPASPALEYLISLVQTQRSVIPAAGYRLTAVGRSAAAPAEVSIASQQVFFAGVKQQRSCSVKLHLAGSPEEDILIAAR